MVLDKCYDYCCYGFNDEIYRRKTCREANLFGLNLKRKSEIVKHGQKIYNTKLAE